MYTIEPRNIYLYFVKEKIGMEFETECIINDILFQKFCGFATFLKVAKKALL